MATLITDKHLERSLRRRRKKSGADRWDEVWEGVYVMAAMPNNEHQDLAGDLVAVLKLSIQYTGRGRVFPGVNISDRPDRWKQNYRCPDVAVYLTENPAEDRSTHWFGGPDLAIEIVSPGEDPHAKLDFYAHVGTRELLIVERDPWRLTLFQLAETRSSSVTVSEIVNGQPGTRLTSVTMPLAWRLIPGDKRPRVETTCTETGQVWHA